MLNVSAVPSMENQLHLLCKLHITQQVNTKYTPRSCKCEHHGCIFTHTMVVYVRTMVVYVRTMLESAHTMVVFAHVVVTVNTVLS